MLYTINNIKINSNDFDFVNKIIYNLMEKEEEERSWLYYKLCNAYSDIRTPRGIPAECKYTRHYDKLPKYQHLFKKELEAIEEFHYLDYMRNITKKNKGEDIIHSFVDKSVKDAKKEYKQILKLCSAFNVKTFKERIN